MQAGAVFHRRAIGALDIVAVGLVDGDDVGELEQAALDALQLVARARDGHHDENIDHVGDGGLGLADADRLDQHHVVAGSLDESDGLARGLGTPPKLSPAGEGRMKAAGSVASRPIRVLSPRIEPPLREEVGSTARTATLWP